MSALTTQRSLSPLRRLAVTLGVCAGTLTAGAALAPAAQAAEKGDAWVSLTTPRGVHSGDTTTMRGRAGGNGHLATDTTVYLHYKVDGEWTYYTRTTTDSAGTFAFRVRPTEKTTFRAVIVETDSYHQGTSYEVTADVWGDAPQAQPASSGNRGQDVVNAAASQAGTPYRTGGAGPGGYDCSGLVQWAYQQIGVSLPRRATQQSHHGSYVNKGQAQPGDLILFGGNGHYYHVGIYAGNGEIWHSPEAGQQVRKQAIWTNGYTIRRVV